MSAAFSPETIAIVKPTALVVQQYGMAITTRMYGRLFVDPEMRALFDEAAQKSGAQPVRRDALVGAFDASMSSL
jgi:nitric oxide dioxygenase